MGQACSQSDDSDSTVAKETSVQIPEVTELSTPNPKSPSVSMVASKPALRDGAAAKTKSDSSRMYESMGIISIGPSSVSGMGRTVDEFIGDNEERQWISEVKFADGHFAKFLKFVHRGVIGAGELMEGPFGATQMIYCDWTASGRQFAPIERYLYSHVSTLYANTHTDTSVTGVQSTRYYHESRELVLSSVGGDPELDTVIFAGSGASGAIDKLMGVISNWSPTIKEECAVFVSAMEHNTNLLLWADNGFTVVTVPSTLSGEELDKDKLEELLAKWSEKRAHIFCSFIAASNVTGILAETDEISRLCHEYNAFVFWDYATAGPYVEIAMSTADNPACNKDAVYLATHKFLGGPSAPGILIAKKTLFRNSIPAIPAGGTVSIAFGNRPGEYEYHTDIPAKEEAGTQDIIGAVRAALCLSLKNQIGTDVIHAVEKQFSQEFIKRVVRNNPNLYVLGGVDGEMIAERKLPVFSINILHTRKSVPSDTRALHCNFVAALLNDLFGIQGRPGCMCAGVYIRYLLGATDISHITHEHNKGMSISTPGMYRLNFHYSMAPDEFDFVCSAVDWVCKHGWKLLPMYSVNGRTSEFRHREWRAKSETVLRSLHDIRWDKFEGKLDYPQSHVRSKSLKSFSRVMDKANSILDSLKDYLPPNQEAADAMVAEFSDEKPWYFLPNELYQDAVDCCGDAVTAETGADEKTALMDASKTESKGMFSLTEEELMQERQKIIDEFLKDRVVTDQSFKPAV